MAKHIELLPAGQPKDVLEILQEVIADGSYIPFPRITEQLTDSDIVNEERRNALVQAALDKMSESVVRGQFKDLAGLKDFLARLGTTHIELSHQIIETIRELNLRVGNDIDADPIQITDGKVLMRGKWILASEASLIRDKEILTRAGYRQEELPRMVRELRLFRGMIKALQAGPGDQFYAAFYENVLPIFTAPQRNELDGIANPKALRSLPPKSQE